MLSDVSMWTAVSGSKSMVTGKQEDGGKVRVSSPKASAAIIDRDLYACKVGRVRPDGGLH